MAESLQQALYYFSGIFAQAPRAGIVQQIVVILFILFGLWICARWIDSMLSPKADHPIEHDWSLAEMPAPIASDAREGHSIGGGGDHVALSKLCSGGDE